MRVSHDHSEDCLSIAELLGGLASPRLASCPCRVLELLSSGLAPSNSGSVRPQPTLIRPTHSPAYRLCSFETSPLGLAAMLSLASLLNPAPPGPPPSAPRHRANLAWTPPATSSSSDYTSLFFEQHLAPPDKHIKMSKDSGGFVKSKAKGTVNFEPFQVLNDAAMREIRRYKIYPFGQIQEYCRHIPYNSGKKDFFEKTGRESFEGKHVVCCSLPLQACPGLDADGLHAVFQYIFKVPGDKNEYTVMWDYNVGLVRMTPFFKCCKYSKVRFAQPTISRGQISRGRLILTVDRLNQPKC